MWGRKWWGDVKNPEVSEVFEAERRTWKVGPRLPHSWLGRVAALTLLALAVAFAVVVSV